MPFDRLNALASKIALEVGVLHVSKHQWFTFSGGDNFIFNQTRQKKLTNYDKLRSFWHCLLNPQNRRCLANETDLF